MWWHFAKIRMFSATSKVLLVTELNSFLNQMAAIGCRFRKGGEEYVELLTDVQCRVSGSDLVNHPENTSIHALGVIARKRPLGGDHRLDADEL